MSIEALTIISPRPIPVMYTSLQAIAASGGVYSPNLSRVELRNRNTNQGVVAATTTHISGNEYEWTAVDINVASIGLNTIDVTAYDLDNGSITETFQIYTDYTAPSFNSSVPNDYGSNVATNTPISVKFDSQMSPLHTISAISIVPTIEGATWQQGASSDLYVLNYSGFLQPYTTYTISISANAKDAIAGIPVDNIYIQAGNNLVQSRTINFTTGAGVGANDPTRRGLNPPQNILEETGKIFNLLDSLSSSNPNINPYAMDTGWASSDYTFRFQENTGQVAPEFRTKTGFGSAINPPRLLNPFRYKPFTGDKRNMPEYKLDGGSAIVLNDIAALSFLSTQYANRHKGFTGVVYNVSEASKLKYIPILLSYDFEDKISGGIVTKLPTRMFSMVWDNPNSRDIHRLHYRIEIARQPSFFKYLVFDSNIHAKTFLVSEDGITFDGITEHGARAGQGQTKFVCPVELEAGIWYVRLRVGGKRL